MSLAEFALSECSWRLAKTEMIFAQRNLISNGLTDLVHVKSTGKFRLTLRSLSSNFGLSYISYKTVAAIMLCLPFLNLLSFIINAVIRLTVFFFDASKAFDKVLINGLIAKLIKKGAPTPFIRILYNWLNNSSCSVAWNGLLGRCTCYQGSW